MNAAVEVEGKLVKVTPGDELNIYTANDLRDELTERLHGVSQVSVDLAQVSEMDSAGYQWLVAVKNLGPRYTVSFVKLSEPVKDFLSLLGVLSQFDGSASEAEEDA
ncbi:STAS domain-containing protein [Reinekea blandensis]|uniref:Anti-anti-sigma factor, putative n=1 Tax=Reinekea blandensis MED297 TaxID=314283 RepID=A4BD10_9GAMM|nr:STAS domain-containing protein [Reinekea blandensis]EAR10092.1 anti-anti-sigma factor, putative [Reinekea sp. MED297] [Reinekea blandensis MED297]